MAGKMLKQNAIRSKNAKLKCHKFSTLQKRKNKMQWKISVLQYWSGDQDVSGADLMTEDTDKWRKFMASPVARTVRTDHGN